MLRNVYVPIQTEHRLSLRQRIINKLVYIALFIVAMALCVVLYWSYTNQDVIDLLKEPIPTTPLEAKVSDTIYLKADFCKKVDATGRVVTRISGNSGDLLAPIQYEKLKPGCYHNFLITVPLPPQITPGTYHVNYLITYRTNPMTTVTENFNSEDFQVK